MSNLSVQVTNIVKNILELQEQSQLINDKIVSLEEKISFLKEHKNYIANEEQNLVVKLSELGYNMGTQFVYTAPPNNIQQTTFDNIDNNQLAMLFKQILQQSQSGFSTPTNNSNGQIPLNSFNQPPPVQNAYYPREPLTPTPGIIKKPPQTSTSFTPSLSIRKRR